ncbi:MAG: DUF4384 domain-containing protein [Bacteroides sp.]|nr:hypothetical protein [Roseburia sp.]MCM1347114.1 DUF4384 domain-containing protein [Bacteroides sp.]MCM1421664.1 DUF4384 domain-containing protein [Bacteroides sp.]
MRLLITFLFIIVFSLAGFCQREATVHGEYTYRGPESVSIAEAKRIASENAKVQAVESEFGSSLTRSVFHNMVDENGIGRSKMLVFGGNDLKGEWIGTKEETFTPPVFENGEITFTVKVVGVAREIVSAPIQYKAQILRNDVKKVKGSDLFALNERNQADTFVTGDDLYMNFCSSVDGFLAVYLVDKDDAYCLLPYGGDEDGKQPVTHGEEYTFFHEKFAPKELRGITDEYNLTCEGEADMNRIYILFSPNMFTKALDYNPNKDVEPTPGMATLPRQLSMEDFQKWLFSCRKRDKSMNVDIREVVIKRK